MKLSSMLKDVWYALWHKAATQTYPDPAPASPERLRGKMYWDEAVCTGCQLCVKDCPTHALHLSTLDGDKKHFVMDYDMNKCIYCAQCLQNCRVGGIRMASNEWSFSADTPDIFHFRYGEHANEASPVASEAERPVDAPPQTPSAGGGGE